MGFDKATEAQLLAQRAIAEQQAKLARQVMERAAVAGHPEGAVFRLWGNDHERAMGLADRCQVLEDENTKLKARVYELERERDFLQRQDTARRGHTP